MIRKHLPEHREDALVGEDGLPWRLDPARRRLEELCAERIAKHPLPGIELEGECDLAIVEIDKTTAVFPPADLLDVDHRGLQTGLHGGVFEIGQRARVFRVLGRSRQMQMAT